MLHRLAVAGSLALAFSACAPVTQARDASADTPAPHRFVRITLPAGAAPTSGRLLVFASDPASVRAASRNGQITAVDGNPSAPHSVFIAAQEVTHLEGGGSVDMNLDQIAFPAPFSTLSGDYLVQAVLDVDHSYNYTGRSGGDLVSAVTAVKLTQGKPLPSLSLAQTVPRTSDPWALSPRLPEAARAALPQARAHSFDASMTSPVLSAFWGRDIRLRARVLVPPGYDAKAATRYPTVYVTHGFTGNYDAFADSIVTTWDAMARQQMPAMIWVYLEEAIPSGTHEFADSVNNGPWGTALTEELIPALEKQYRMDGKPSGRFLTGHSSGGWATLWLQTRYPKLFGGTWSTSPDPTDFHDFTGVDLYAPNANMYRLPDGSVAPMAREAGKVVATAEDLIKIERVLGPYGGQLASYESVFSPRGDDGAPMPLFDRDTGQVDPKVAAYWTAHYDIAARLAAQWPQLAPDLDGKIHVIVGTADTFYLDGPARRLKAVLDRLHAKSDVRFREGRTHFDLYQDGDDEDALLKQITREMYAVARPGQ